MNKLTDWQPKPGWLMMTPVILPQKTEGGIFVPDSETVKSTSGIVTRIAELDTPEQHELLNYIGKEVFFAQHDAYKIHDTDTNELLYVLHSSKVIMWRIPQATPKFFPVSKEKDGVQFPSSLTHSMGGEPE